MSVSKYIWMKNNILNKSVQMKNELLQTKLPKTYTCINYRFLADFLGWEEK